MGYFQGPLDIYNLQRYSANEISLFDLKLYGFRM